MRFINAFYYLIVLLFLVWCAITFRTDIGQIQFAPVWAARDAVFVAALLSLFNYALRVIRWSVYLAGMGYPVPLRFAGLTYLAGLAFTLSPGKVGEMIRGKYYQKIGIPFSSTAAAFFVERLLDLLVMVALGLLAFAALNEYHTLIWGVAGVIAGVLAALMIVPWDKVSGWLAQTARIPKAFVQPLASILRTLYVAGGLLRPRFLILGFLLGLVGWGAEGVGLMVVGAISPSVPIDWATATGIYAVGIIVGALSFLPGGLGSTEAVMVALLAAHGYTMPDAMLLTLVFRLLTLWLAVAIGWLAVIAIGRNSM